MLRYYYKLMCIEYISAKAKQSTAYLINKKAQVMPAPF
ncbi:hypothetical protein AO385_1149 [Moraxella catarrhalis]|uniref:Uncharacterized protein n=1 Tax=Moraxella catarrhalis TaxID=480 RepID=A0A198UR01_MORCA|nr:hypothetical protein AO383_1608 [Moraxella catarrhalis]OAU97687.1 hypothetical protein AO384_0373 [Moraxella catarrhalis]OAV00753.1 hypothetical protein AO385_1149 [Moraxella catarrhalis]